MIIRWVAEVKVKLVCMRVDLALFVECVASEEEVIWSQWSEGTAELSLHNSSATHRTLLEKYCLTRMPPTTRWYSW